MRSPFIMVNDISNSFNKIGLFVYTFYMLTAYVYYSILNSHSIAILILTFAMLLMLFAIIISRKGMLSITTLNIFWMTSLIPILLSIKETSFETFMDIFVYFSCIILLLFSNIKIDLFNQAFRLIKIFSIIYALSTIWQYFFIDQYMKYIFPLFVEFNQGRILYQLNGGGYPGITSQVSHTAGYIVYGIGLILFSWKNQNNKGKIIDIISIIILLTGLLLTSKRAHAIFLIAAFLLTVYFSSVGFSRTKKIIKYFGILSVFLISLIPISSFFGTTNSIERIKNTFTNFIEGEDITSGRIILYRHAWDLFSESPIFGIGWRGFQRDSLGLLSSTKVDHVHNVFLQLLTETGLIGFILIVIPMFLTLYLTIVYLKRLSTYGIKNSKWYPMLCFSLYIQIFFIFYCLVENALYNKDFLVMYFLSCAVINAAIIRRKEVFAIIK